MRDTSARLGLGVSTTCGMSVGVECDGTRLRSSCVRSRSDRRLNALMRSFSDTNTTQHSGFASSSRFFQCSCHQSTSEPRATSPGGSTALCVPCEAQALLLALAAPAPTPARHVAAIEWYAEHNTMQCIDLRLPPFCLPTLRPQVGLHAPNVGNPTAMLLVCASPCSMSMNAY